MTSRRSQRLERVSTDDGHFAILAMDHVRSLAQVIAPDDPDSIDPVTLVDTKVAIANGLAAHASALLIDPAMAIDERTRLRDIPGVNGLVLGIEDGDYADVHTTPRLLPGWSVERAAALDIDALKISVFFDADGDSATACRFVEEVATQCRRFDLPLFCEPLALMTDDDGQRRRHILEGVRLFGDLGVDVLKIQFPERTSSDVGAEAWADACLSVDELSPTPWTLLSEGMDFELFLSLLETACRSGASGFLGGRAVWGDVVSNQGELAGSAQRLDQLGSIVGQYGHRWQDRLDATEPSQEGS